MSRVKTLQVLFKRYRRPGDIVFAWLILGVSLFLLSQIFEETAYKPGANIFAQPRFWPAVSLSCMTGFAAFHLLGSLLSERIEGRWQEVLLWVSSLEYAGWFIAYAMFVPFGGYLPSTIIFAVLLTLRAGYRSRRPLIAAALSAVVIVLLFKTFLQVKLPSGRIYEFLPDGLRQFMLTNFLSDHTMEDLIAGAEMLARWDVMIALLVGSIGGVIIGAIPGVGPAVAIAILLPATFSLDPIVGLTMLLGIYGSSMYGGAIPAVLINTPGTAVNALTSYDGYPMTQAGEAHRAVSLAYAASFWGGIFGIVCLILLSPVLALVAPMFGSREIFLAAFLGIILVVLAHRGQIFAAGLLAMFGIFLQTVGLDAITYTQRYTFGYSFLTSGINLIVVVLGLFALSQAFFLLTAPDSSPDAKPVSGKMTAGIKELMKHKRVATVASGFGVILGMIPGTGEFTAQFMSYTYAQKTSKNPELFGKGSPEGLIASEAANNAVPAAAMIPLLALGIPGEALTAMMLSVFYVHNVIPGPQLFQNNIDLVYGLYFTLILLNIIVMIFLLFSTNMLTKIIRVPTRFLGVMILILSFVGVYSLRNSLTDCIISAGFGVLGLILKRLNLPIVPIILGMVLGGIMEVKLRSAMPRLKTPFDMIDRPIAFILFTIILLVIALHIRTLINEFRAHKPDKDHDIHDTHTR